MGYARGRADAERMRPDCQLCEPLDHIRHVFSIWSVIISMSNAWMQISPFAETGLATHMQLPGAQGRARIG